MNKQKIKSLVKYNKLILSLYSFFGNILISIIKCFTKVKKNKILFMSFGGLKFDDSPKVLYENIINDPFFDGYEIVWAFVNPNDYEINRGEKIKVDTFHFYKIAISCGIWINNSSVERGLHLKTKKTLEFNTWHGTPLKKMGCDIENYKGYSRKPKKIGKTIYCSQSKFDQDIWTRLFNTTKDNIIISDLPRNDYLVNYKMEDILYIKEKLKIPHDKKVILYAPTFREYDRDSSNGCFINPPINIKKWKELLGDKYLVLFRAHYEVMKALEIENNDFIIDVSKYPFLNDLMIISDLLISDYSSIFFDYSILERPMLCFAYDYETYSIKRGLYEESYSKLPSNIYKDEDSLIEAIIFMNYEEMANKTKLFKSQFAPKAGKASSIVVEKIKEEIKCLKE